MSIHSTYRHMISRVFLQKRQGRDKNDKKDKKDKNSIFLLTTLGKSSNMGFVIKGDSQNVNRLLFVGVWRPDTNSETNTFVGETISASA